MSNQFLEASNKIVDNIEISEEMTDMNTEYMGTMETDVCLGENEALTENGALSYARASESELINQFGKAGSYMGRSIEDVWGDMSALWDENPVNAIRFTFYLRMITRKTTFEGKVSENVQNGQGLRDESFKRLLWISKYHHNDFVNILYILPIVGSWKDLWTLLLYAHQEKEVFDDSNSSLELLTKDVFCLLSEGLRDESTCDLVKKFMPRVKSGKHLKTDRARVLNDSAKAFANYLKLSYADYNRIKTSGTAHDFQKIICSRRYNEINWNKIPGKALLNLASGEFIARHGLENSYMAWLDKQGTVKFNGYPFELMQKAINAGLIYLGRGDKKPYRYKTVTIDKQFDELVKCAMENGQISENVWCAIDTSGSMTHSVANTTAYNICVSLGVFFSTINNGEFHKQVVMFDDTSRLLKLEGGFCNMVSQIMSDNTTWGSTSFQSVIDLLIDVRNNNPNIPIEDYPTTILVVSDMQFNPVGYSGWANEEQRITNIDAARKKISAVFPQEYADKVRFIWWDCTGRCDDAPDTTVGGKESNSLFLSGFDGSILSFILGQETPETEDKEATRLTMEEVVEKALSQEVLSLIN